MQDTSTKWVFDGVDFLKTLRTLGVLILGTVTSYLLQAVIPSLTVSPITIMVLTTLVEAIRRWATDHTA
jgi:hypothetical protein